MTAVRLKPSKSKSHIFQKHFLENINLSDWQPGVLNGFPQAEGVFFYLHGDSDCTLLLFIARDTQWTWWPNSYNLGCQVWRTARMYDSCYHGDKPLDWQHDSKCVIRSGLSMPPRHVWRAWRATDTHVYTLIHTHTDSQAVINFLHYPLTHFLPSFFPSLLNWVFNTWRFPG